ncbi:MAG: PEP-CTERM sorting domain-containing protein [Chthoniobacterales bacterium]
MKYNLIQRQLTNHAQSSCRAPALSPAEMAAYHGTAAGHIRLLRTILFGAETRGQLLKHRRLSFVPMLCLFMALTGFSGSLAHGAVISWNPAMTISGTSTNTSNPSTAFYLFGAFNVAGPTVVVPTTTTPVTFAQFPISGTANSYTATNANGSFTLASSPNIAGTTNFGSNLAPFNNLEANYRGLLQSGASTLNAPLTLTINGLTVGGLYSIQVWANYSDATLPYSESVSGGNATSLIYNTSSPTMGGLGQFVTGTFTATSTSQAITLTGIAGPANKPLAVLNAFQIRSESPIIPEPSSIALLAAAGLCALVVAACRRRTRPAFGALGITSGLLLLALTGAPAQATIINWGSGPQTISGTAAGTTDVSTLGTLFGAANNGTTGVSAVTINGVVFNPFVTDGSAASVTSGNFRLSSGPNIGGSNFGYGGGPSGSPFGSLSAPYQNLLFSASAVSNAPLTLTISGLTNGQLYLVQLWASFSDPGFFPGVSEDVSGGNPTTLQYNTTFPASGGVGQFVTGTFTASGTTQSIALTGLGPPMQQLSLLNAFQVRAIPEPSTWAMMTAGLALLVASIRFRVRHN